MQATSETHHDFFSFGPSTSIQSLNAVAGCLQRRDTGMAEGCWQFPSLSFQSCSDIENHLLQTAYRMCWAPCGHICFTDRALDNY